MTPSLPAPASHTAPSSQRMLCLPGMCRTAPRRPARVQLGAPPPFLTGAGVTNTASAPATASVALRNALGLKAALESGLEAPRHTRAFRRLKREVVLRML